jgi:hypothetical protein
MAPELRFPPRRVYIKTRAAVLRDAGKDFEIVSGQLRSRPAPA